MSEEHPDGRRVCVVGDALVAGLGDPKALGWTGRVAARTPHQGRPFALFPLGIPGETTSTLVERWTVECLPRWSARADNRLVVGLGREDISHDISRARSRLNLAKILEHAERVALPVMVVGPPPALDPRRQAAVGELSQVFGEVCARRQVTYIDCFGPLANHEQWFADVAAGDGVNPGQAGYGLMAWLVLHNGWYSWLDSSPQRS